MRCLATLNSYCPLDPLRNTDDQILGRGSIAPQLGWARCPEMLIEEGARGSDMGK